MHDPQTKKLPPSGAPALLFRGLIPAKLEEISNKLADPSQLPSLHRFITRTEITARAREGDVEVIQFDIWEKIPIFWVSLPNKYKGEIRRNTTTPFMIILEGNSPGGVRVYVRFQIRALNLTQCEVKEEIWLEAPWLVRSLLEKFVNAAHAGLLSRLAFSFSSARA